MGRCSDPRRGLWLPLVILSGWVGMASANAVETTVSVTPARPLPEAIQRRIASLLEDTVQALFEPVGTLTTDALAADPVGIAAQVRTGLNWELEDRGYHLTTLELQPGDPIAIAATLDLAGGGVEQVTLALAPGELPVFWEERYRAELATVEHAALTSLEPVLIGLPIGPRNRDWARQQVEESWQVPAMVAALWPDHTVTLEVRLGDTAEVLLSLTPAAGPVVRTVRVEARSESLLMATLDPIEELLGAQTPLLLDQPMAQVQAAAPEIEALLAEEIAASRIAAQFHIRRPEVRLSFPETKPEEARVITVLESERYHLRVEAFVDLGNDEVPAELQAHAGWRIGPVVPFLVLNVPTRDPEVRPDAGLGFADGPWFLGGAWDITEGAPKLFAAWTPIPQLRLSVEAYRQQDDGQTQLGVLYQPTQQLGIGVFTDADSRYWVRTSFRL